MKELNYIKTFESFNSSKVYHATTKEELNSILSGIEINKVD
jgi:hypothetical protein